MKNTFNQDIGKLSNIHDHNGKLRALKEISKMSKTHAILEWLLFQLNYPPETWFPPETWNFSFAEAIGI